MTTLYKPVKITSAEQAEALPIGTVAFDPSRMRGPLLKEASNYWFGDRSRDNEEVADMGYTALVPIEAEETRDEGTGWIVPTAFGPKLMGAYLGSPDDTPAKRYTQTTWRTPWTPTEEA